MAKKNNKKVKIESSSSFNGEYKKIVIITLSVLAFLAAFYFITVAILNKDDNSTKNDTNKDTEVEIQYKEILVGTSFSMKDSSYLVVYYNTTDKDNASDISSAISTYRTNNKDSHIYYVDMNNALNKNFVSGESNSSASSAEELKINGPTLINFADGKIVEYVEGKDRIIDYLS